MTRRPKTSLSASTVCVRMRACWIWCRRRFSPRRGGWRPAFAFSPGPEAIDPVIDACFAETTTLGVRFHVERRAILAREATTSDDGIDVKLAKRPGGRPTAKAESDDLAGIVGHASREEARRSAEADALSRREAKEEET